MCDFQELQEQQANTTRWDYPENAVPLARPGLQVKTLQVGTHYGTCCGDVKRGEAPSCVRVRRMLQGQ